MTRTTYLSLIIVAAVLAGACQKAANITTNTNTGNTLTANSNANSAPAANNAAADDPGNYNGSPTEVYKAAYTARKNCDLAGLRKVMSKELLDFMTKMGKDDKKPLDDELKELCSRPQASSAQARNEKINAEKASIEYLAEDNTWERMDFIREDGAWKMSLPTPGEDEPNSKDDKEDNRS